MKEETELESFLNDEELEQEIEEDAEKGPELAKEENQENDSDVFFDDLSVEAGGGEFKPLEVFKAEASKTAQITFLERSCSRRYRHTGRAYKPAKDRLYETKEEAQKDLKKDEIVYPRLDDDGKALSGFQIYAPSSPASFLYRACLGPREKEQCPACCSAKVNLSFTEPSRVTKSAPHFAAKIFVWETDVAGNLLDEETGRPVDAEGKFIKVRKGQSWDRVSYEKGERKGRPHGESKIYYFNGAKFAQIRNIVQINKTEAFLPELNILVNCTKEQFQEVSFTHLPRSQSAAFYNKKMLGSELDRCKDIDLKHWICQTTSWNKMIVELGLEASLLQIEKDLPF